MIGPPRGSRAGGNGRRTRTPGSVLLGRDGRHLDHLKSPYLVNIHHLTGDSKNGLNVVFSKFLDQLANRWVVLGGERNAVLSVIFPTSRRMDSLGFTIQIMMIIVILWSQQQFFYVTFFCLRERG